MVRRSSSMMPILSVLRGRPSSVLDAVEQLVGEGDFVRPVHLRLDDIDRAGAAVARPAVRPESRAARSGRDRGVEDAFRHRRRRRGRGRASSVIRWPTLRTSIRLRPGSVERRRRRARYRRGRRSSRRVNVLPPLSKVVGERRPSSGRASCDSRRPCPRHRRRRSNLRSP